MPDSIPPPAKTPLTPEQAELFDLLTECMGCLIVFEALLGMSGKPLSAAEVKLTIDKIEPMVAKLRGHA